VAADHDGRVGVWEQLRSGEHVIGRGGQRVLIGAAVDMFTHQLLGSAVGDGADG
jgi:hypothetical protein